MYETPFKPLEQSIIHENMLNRQAMCYLKNNICLLEAQGKTNRYEPPDEPVNQPDYWEESRKTTSHAVVTDLLNMEGAFKLKKYLGCADSMTYGQHQQLWCRVNALSKHHFKHFIASVTHKLETTCDTALKKKFAGLFKNFRKHLCKVKSMAIGALFLEAHVQFNFIKTDISPEVVKLLSENIPILTSALGNKAQEWTARIIRLVITLLECAAESPTSSKIRSIISFFSDFFCQSVADSASTLAHAFSRLLVGEELEAQYGEEGVFQSAFSLFTTLFGAKTAAGINFDIMRLKRLETIWKVAKYGRDIMMFVYSLLKEWIDYYTESFFGTTPTKLFFNQISDGIPQWMAQVANLYNSNGPMVVARDFVKAKEAIELKKVGDDFLVQLQRLRNVPASMMGYFMTTYNQIKELAKTAMSLSFNDQSRFTPFVLYLYGESNIGKSMAQDFLLKDLFISTGRPFDYRRDVYVRNVQQDHWDGYLGQPAVIFDDFCQDLDPTTRMSELNELIRMKNTAAYPLKMAHLEEKGNVKFVSDFVYISANQELGNELCSLVSHPDAILRRRDVVANVKLRPEYALPNGHINKQKLHPDWSFDPRIYTFSIMDPLNNTLITDSLSYFDFVRYCAREWNVLRKHDLRVIDSIPSWDMRLIEESINNIQLEAQMRIPFFGGEAPQTSVVPTMPVLTLGHDVLRCDVATLFQNESITYMDSFKEWIKDNTIIKTASIVAGVLALVVGLKTLFSSKDPKEPLVSEHNISGDMRTRATKPATKREKKQALRRNPLFAESLAAEACSDPHAMTIIANRIRNNTCVIKYKTATICGLAICDTIVVIPSHFMSFNPTLVHMHFLTQVIDVDLSQCDYRIDDDKDLVFVRLPRKFGQFTSILNHFHTDASVGLQTTTRGLLIPTHLQGTEIIHAHYQAVGIELCGPQEYVAKGYLLEEPQRYQIANGYSYSSCTSKGDCGAPLVALNPSLNRKIIGIHVAGYNDYGVSTVVTKEYMEEILSTFPGVIIQKEPDVPIESLEAQTAIAYSERVEIFGKLPKPIYNHGKTEIHLTSLSDLYGTKTLPAILREKEGKDPMKIAIQDQFVPNVVLPDSDVSLIQSDLMNYYGNLLGNSKHYARVLSLDESINGITGDEYLKPIDIHTSPGYPLIYRTKGKPGKTAFLLGSEPPRTCSDELMSQISMIESDIDLGIVPPILFMDTLKDERREIAKVEACKTRVFNVAPLAFNVVVRKYFLGFSAAVMQNHHCGEIAVGINPHGDEWGMLHKRMKSDNKKWLAGDFSKYDKQLSFQLIEACLPIIQDFYRDEFSTQRRAIWLAMFNAYHIVGDVIYRCRQGNPSGNPMTVIINSLVNQFIMRYAYLAAARSLGKCRSLHDFSQRIQLVVYGDDNLMSVDPADAEVFNMVTISKVLSDVKIKYTDSSKGEVTSLFVEANEVSFLKRKFRYDNGICHGPLPLDIIKEMIAWKRGAVCDEMALKEVWESVIIELSHHEQSTFVKTQDEIITAATRRGFRIVPRMYGDVIFKRLYGRDLN